MTDIEQCRKCQYRGTLDGRPCCDYSWITGQCRTKHIRKDGSCGVFAEGDPKKVEFNWNDVPIKPTRNIPMKYDGLRMLELYRKGWNDHEIARDIGCTASAVRCWRKREGLEPNVRSRPPKTKIDRALFRLLYDQGMSDGQIARAIRCGATTVGDWRRGAGLKPNFEPFWAKKKGEKDSA